MENRKSDMRRYLLALAEAPAQITFCHKMDERHPLWNYARHSHEAMELICFLDGSLLVRQGEARLTAAAGSVLLHPPGVPHQEFPKPGRERSVIALWIAPGGQAAFAGVPENSVELPDREGCLRWLFQQIYKEYRADTGESAALTGHYLCALLLKLAQGVCAESGESPVKRAARYLEDNYAGEVSMARLACACAVSASYLERQFKKEFSHSPVRHLQLIRMEEAQKLLRYSALSVEEVAQRVGFSDSGYFRRVFRRHTGLTPTAWRKRRG